MMEESLRRSALGAVGFLFAVCCTPLHCPLLNCGPLSLVLLSSVLFLIPLSTDSLYVLSAIPSICLPVSLSVYMPALCISIVWT